VIFSSGGRAILVNSLRLTILQLESNIPAALMHPNWHILRKPWISAVGTCLAPKDFAKTLVVLQTCIKPVVFNTVWHEQLGKLTSLNLIGIESLWLERC